jgi:hypothetical protein
MKKFNRLFLLIVLFSSSYSYAQKFTSFSEDSVKFVKELDFYFQDNTANKDDAEKFVKNFEKFWKTPEFKKEYKDYVYKTCNKMLIKKMKPYPFFQDYLISVANFINSKKEFSDFESWQKTIEKILAAKGVKSYDQFLEMSLNLFESNIFYKTPSYTWGTIEGEYKFEFESCAPKPGSSAFKELIKVFNFACVAASALAAKSPMVTLRFKP